MRPVRRPLVALVGAVVLGAAACGGGGKSHQPATTAVPTQPAFVATLRAPGHRPRAGKPWPIVLTAQDDSGRPLRAEVRYQFLFAGRVVARRSRYRFRGRFHDVVTWPRRSVGVPLTFRAVVATGLGTRNLDYPVVIAP